MLQVHCLSEVRHFGQRPQRSCSLHSRFLFDIADWKNLRLRPKTKDQEGSSMVTHTYTIPKRISAVSKMEATV